MSWYRTGTVAVTNGSKTVTGVGTLWTTAVNVGDAFALVDANLNPTGAWYEVDVIVSNTELTLKQSYAGTTGSNNQYCVFNMVGNMTTPSFAQRLATFFASFQSLIDKPKTTPTAASIPVADANGDIDSGWLKDASTTVKGVVKVGNSLSSASGVLSVVPASATVKGAVELATPAEILAGTDTERGITPATLTAKILGTVSQTGGVPTGAVIERGSNANGYYVKFADGTMICWIPRKTFSSVACTTLVTTGVRYISGGVLCPLPAAFNGQLASVSFSNCGMANTPKPYYADIVVNNYGMLSILFESTVSSTGDAIISITVVGRWY